MMMLRATLFALALLSASAFKFVSQTFKGEHTDHYSNTNGSATTHTVEFGLDMESVKFRSNYHVVGKIGNSKVSMIFDVEAKRVTTWNEIEIAGHPSATPECMYSEFPSLPAPAVVAKCLQDFVADAEPTTSEQFLRNFPTAPKHLSGLQKFHIPILRKFPYSTETVVCTDDLFVMKKIIADLSQPDAHAMPIHAEMTDMKSKAGAPDSSIFVVPTEWGTCTKIDLVFLGMDDIPRVSLVGFGMWRNDINPIMRAFSNCMELGASQAPIVV